MERLGSQSPGVAAPWVATESSQPPMRVVVVSPHLPRACALSYFTADLLRALERLGRTSLAVAAVGEPAYGRRVRWRLEPDDVDSCVSVARKLNAEGLDAVCVQHDYRMFGCRDGELVLRLLERLDMPVVTTLHRTTARPDAHRRAVTRALADRSGALVVPAAKAKAWLTDAYGIPDAKVHHIPYGAPAADALAELCAPDVGQVTPQRRATTVGPHLSWPVVAGLYRGLLCTAAGLPPACAQPVTGR